MGLVTKPGKQNIDERRYNLWRKRPIKEDGLTKRKAAQNQHTTEINNMALPF